MTRFEIAGKFKGNHSRKVEVVLQDPNAEEGHEFRNYFIKKRTGIIYQQNPSLNRFDVNQTLLDQIVKRNIQTKLWTIDPKYLTLEMAVEIAKLGNGMFLSDRYKKMWELSVIRYACGERNFMQLDDKYQADKLYSEAEYAQGDLSAYVYEFLNEHRGYLDIEQEAYQKEEKRATEYEIARLEEKEDLCMDLMTKVVVAKRSAQYRLSKLNGVVLK
jgi:hypothetical protein